MLGWKTLILASNKLLMNKSLGSMYENEIQNYLFLLDYWNINSQFSIPDPVKEYLA